MIRRIGRWARDIFLTLCFLAGFLYLLAALILE